MTPTQLRQLGEALYGPRWQSDLARDLGVSDRTVRRWVGGQPSPHGAVDDLYRLVGIRTLTLGAAVAEIWG